MNGAKTQEELIEQIEEDAFAEHILVETLEEMANEILDEMKDAAHVRKFRRTSP